MNISEIKKNARGKMKGFCKVCPECNGVACAGEVPGMGGTGTAASFKSNVSDLKKIKLRLKTIHSATKPDTSAEIFGHKLQMPIISAPVTGNAFNMGGALSEEEYADAVVDGSIAAGTIAMTGDSADLSMYIIGIEKIGKVNGKGIPIIKPRENDKIIKNIRMAEKINPIGIGIDIDGAGLVTMALKGQPVGPKTEEALKEVIASTNLPFILKGIMTVEEAEMAVEIGAKAIVVSNHGGRILDYAQSSSDVLSEIADKVKGKITILVDGGIRTGTDVFKMIALGADAVLVGRPVIIGAYGDYKDGVHVVLENMKNELAQSMILTGCKDLKSIDKTKIVIS